MNPDPMATDSRSASGDNDSRPASGNSHERGVSRRDLLRAAAVAPVPLVAGEGFLRWLPGGDDRCLVVLELEGGNDGLNTLIPLEDAAYRKARPQIGSVRRAALPLGDGYGLHSALSGVHGLIKQGLGCVVHGVGYPEPDRSHFRSRDIWHTADPTYREMKVDTTGWLGRAADELARLGAAVPGLSVGSLGVPLMLKGRNVVVPSLQRVEDYQLIVDTAGGRGDERRARMLEMARGAPGGEGGKGSAGLSSFVNDVAREAVKGAESMRAALARYRAKAEFPPTSLGRSLQLLSRILVSGFGTRLFRVSYGGFDTHSRQLPAHQGLLRQVSLALTALVQDLKAHGMLDRVAVLVFSEFGRRVAENRSQGTDHGAAGPVFLFGGGVKPGTAGRPPSLTDLQGGDLRATCDFRELYAATLRHIGVDAKKVLGGSFDGVNPFVS